MVPLKRCSNRRSQPIRRSFKSPGRGVDDEGAMASPLRRQPSPTRQVLLAVLAAGLPLAAQTPPPTSPPAAAPEPPAGGPLQTLGSRLGNWRLDNWAEHLRLYGFAALRAFDTGDRGSAPDGAVGIQAATLFVDADVPEIGRAFLELRLDYFQEAGGNDSGIGEAWFTIDDAFGLGADHAVDLRFGRFDLPFGEYYLLEDPDKNRMIGFPAVMPYRWDEGVMAIVSRDSWGVVAAITDGSYSRNSEGGIGPGAVMRGHVRPTDGLYVSASVLWMHEVADSALCLGGSRIGPVRNSANGTSPSAEVSSLLGSLDLRWQLSDAMHLQASVGGGNVDDDAPGFDRSLVWWMLEPTVRLTPDLEATLRWSGGGTFAGDEGFQLESRPYGNGIATYGDDLSSIQRLALGVRERLHPRLAVKAEVGFDRLKATTLSGRGDTTGIFVGAEIVLTF
jgi:hypothetical protein